MPVSQSDLVQLQQQIADLSAAVATKQDAQVMNDQNDNVLGVKDCLGLLERKMKAMEDRMNMGISNLHMKIQNTDQRLADIDAKVNGCVNELKEKMDIQATMMKEMYGLLNNMTNRPSREPTETEMPAAVTNPRGPLPSTDTPFCSSNSVTNFDYKLNAKIVVFGIPEPDSTPTIGSTEKTESRPTVRAQIEKVFNDAAAKYAPETLRSAKRLGTYQPGTSAQARARPLCVQFSSPDTARNFLGDNGSSLRGQGIGMKWWRPLRPKIGTSANTINTMAARIEDSSAHPNVADGDSPSAVAQRTEKARPFSGQIRASICSWFRASVRPVSPFAVFGTRARRGSPILAYAAHSPLLSSDVPLEVAGLVRVSGFGFSHLPACMSSKDAACGSVGVWSPESLGPEVLPPSA
ncbi:hypothetical protein FOZ60_000672 [Perkinsus olseni]|uniref:Uncharacterized protein n=1 Tax=Perkinsus olseni TaxID=32597 RepID=A0A7J6MZ72_PEROL|nr:hypothetical protein FOZ60_000672 [Perkinsus olseni]